MKNRLHTLFSSVSALAVAALTHQAQATEYWWDSDDITPGFGNTAGTWGTSAFWSTSSAGTAATTAAVTSSSDIVNFGTASLNYANGAVDIAASGVTVNSIVYGAGQTTPITLGSAGNTLTLDGTTPTITVNHASAAQTISSPVAGSAGLTKAGNGILALSGSNSYTGATTISGGTLSVNTLANAGSNSSIGAFATPGATGLTLSAGTTLNYTGASTTTDRGFTATGGTKKTINVGAGVELALGASGKNETASGANALTFAAGGAGSSIAISSMTITAGSNGDFNISTNTPTVTIQNLYVTGNNVIVQRTGTALLKVGDINGTTASGWLGNLNVTGVISGYTAGIILGNDVTLSGLSTFNTTVTLQQNGTYTFNSIKNVGGGASALGNPLTVANGTIGAGNGTNSFTFKYIGTGDITDRVLNLRGSTGTVTLEQAGESGLLKFTSALTATGGGSKTLRLSGSTDGTGELAGAIVDNSATNKTSVSKIGTSKWTLSGANTYTGTTTVTDGTLALGANNVLPDTSAVSINGATANLDAATFADTAGTLAVTGDATINLGSGAALAFADSSAVTWSGTLNVVGTLTPTSLRFGGSISALTLAQRDSIRVNGEGLGDYTLDANGFLILDPGVPDTTPPNPSPMTWAIAPVATGESSVTMTATTATDPNDVEYWFTETSGNPGGTSSSDWQNSPVYTDTGLTPATTYSYTVTARDKSLNQNETVPSAVTSVNTDPADTIAPTPNPMTFDTPPTATSISKITMTATTATDPYGVEYYFTCTLGGGHDSGWQDSPVYTDNWLNSGTSYTYTVKARDKSLGQNVTTESAPASASTNTQLAGEILWSQPQNTTAISDVVTTGTLHFARHGENIATPAFPLTVNGVEFVPGPVLNKGANADTCLASAPDELEALLDRFSWSFFGTTTTFTTTGLTPGAKYMIQIFLTDQRGPVAYSETYDDTVGNSVVLSTGSPGDTDTYGQFVIGTFTAKPDGTQTVHTTNVINAFQVRLVSAPPSSPFDIWANGTFANGTLSDKNPASDPDGDGKTNQQEFAFGLDPTTGASVNPISQPLNKSTGVFKHTRTKDSGLTYIYQSSTTLSDPWDAFTPVTDPPPAASISATVEEVTVTVPPSLLTGPKLFLRVKAQ